MTVSLCRKWTAIPRQMKILSWGKARKRFLSQTSQNDDLFITLPIFYVNSAPHIGHLYTSLLGDALRRWELIKNPRKEVFLASGTDEHGTKIENAARNAFSEPGDFCDRMSHEFKVLFRHFDIEPSCFIRTTDQKHRRAVEHFWNSLMKNGFIYKGKYEGWYSVTDEVFYPESEVGPDPNNPDENVCVASGQPVQWVQEENYMFRLGGFQQKIRSWLTESDVIQPSFFLPYTLGLVDECDEDVSVSRSRKRLKWGIPVPQDDTQTIYVWLDALVNYLTVAGYPDTLSPWPPHCQIIGKDILKFHAIFWPAFLMAAGLPLPQKIFIHSHWTVYNTKISKSRGNRIDPFLEAEKLTEEGLRYFLIRQGVPHQDADYSHTKALQVINSQLSNLVGNLVSRSMQRAMNPEQVYPPFHEDIFTRGTFPDDGPLLLEGLSGLADRVSDLYDKLLFYKAVDLLCAGMRQTHAFYQYHTPWKHKSNTPQDRRTVETVLHVTYESMRIIGILLQPLIPRLSDQVLTRLGVPGDERTREFAILSQKMVGRTFGPDRGQLFPKLDKDTKT